MKTNKTQKMVIFSLVFVIGFIGCDDFFDSSKNEESVPKQMTSLKTQTISSDFIQLQWSGQSNVENYKIYFIKGEDEYSPKTLVQTIPGNYVFYKHTGLSASTTYMYYITAVNGAGESEYSPGLKVKTSWGGGILTVNGYNFLYDGRVLALTSSPATFDEFFLTKNNSFGNGFIDSNTCSNWDNGRYAPPDGTYTIIIYEANIFQDYNSKSYYQNVYKFDNVTIKDGYGTVPYDKVAGTAVGTNGRLK